ncbi:MAG: Mg-dependent DNase [Candidatus Bathyarchaeota archaeon B23]|nr:MAG: Mg-dependent DNase [Candidatus Bathyarchaeota archaeon B23]
MPRRLIDTHAHLDDFEEMGGVIQRAREAGVDAIIAVGANMRACRLTLKWAEAYPGYVYPALGVHPTEWFEEDVEETLRFVEEHLNRCVAVGEIGLDYWSREARKNKAVRRRQREIYVRQLEMAVECDKPASIHSRGSWRDALDLALEHGPDRAVFHWYSGPLDVLKELLDAGFYISATPAIEHSRHHRAALLEAPLERILLETDSPVESRGRPSEPASLPLVARALAELKEVPVEEVVASTTRSAELLFRL